MNVKVGWNTKYAETKFDVLMEEVDLVRMLVEAGIPAEAAATLPATMAFRLMLAEAEIFSKSALVMAGAADNPDKVLEELGQQKAKRAELLEQVKNSFAVT